MGAAFNALMEEETKESLAKLCCDLMDDINSGKNKKVEDAEIAFAARYQKAIKAGWLAQDGSVVAPPAMKQYEFLNSDFLALMNDIGRLGHEKFQNDSFEVAGNERRIPRHRKDEIMAHAHRHLWAYEAGVKHDKMSNMQAHLAAAAVNAMLEFIFSQGE